MESPQKSVSTQMQLRAAHQACATVAARTDVVPESFRGDPTFAELVAAKKAIVKTFGIPPQLLGISDEAIS